MNNLYEKLQAIREANDQRKRGTVREMIMKLQREITIGEVTPEQKLQSGVLGALSLFRATHDRNHEVTGE